MRERPQHTLSTPHPVHATPLKTQASTTAKRGEAIMTARPRCGRTCIQCADRRTRERGRSQRALRTAVTRRVNPPPSPLPLPVFAASISRMHLSAMRAPPLAAFALVRDTVMGLVEWANGDAHFCFCDFPGVAMSGETTRQWWRHCRGEQTHGQDVRRPPGSWPRALPPPRRVARGRDEGRAEGGADNRLG